MTTAILDRRRMPIRGRVLTWRAAVRALRVPMRAQPANDRAPIVCRWQRDSDGKLICRWMRERSDGTPPD